MILTNGDQWQAHRVIFGKPVKTELAFDFSFSDTGKLPVLVDFFFLISKEGVKKPAIDVFHEESQLTSKYMIAAAMQTELVLTAIRRQLSSVSKKVRIDNDQIMTSLQNLVLKREVQDEEEAAKAKRKLAAAERAKKKAATRPVVVVDEEEVA